MINELKIKLPALELPVMYESPMKYLQMIVKQQAESKGLTSDIYHKRIAYELAEFERCNAIEYLIRVWTLNVICQVLPELTIQRGMVSASLVCYLLDIAKFDAEKYGLMFSRFISESTTSIGPFEFSVGKDLFDLSCDLTDLGFEIERGDDKDCIILHKATIPTLIDKTLDNIHITRGLDITPDDIPLDDAATFQRLSFADTEGIPCLLGEELAQIMFKQRPTHFEQMIPLCALNRMGEIKKLSEYYGYVAKASDSLSWESEMRNPPMIIYQEQITNMALARGFNSMESEQIRKFVNKRALARLEEYRERWIKSSDESSWDLIIDSGLYTFPKAYAIVLAYQSYVCAYLKTHFPEEYTRAALCVVASDLC